MALKGRTCLGCGAGLEAGRLSCEYCGLSHIMSGDGGFAAACRSCGAGNAPGGAGCVSCGADLCFDCPECRARLPLGSRFCAECRIELARYRAPRLVKLPNRIPAAEVEAALRGWLGSGWLRACDASQRVVVMDQSLTWLPFWRFEARFAGTVTGQQAQTHYRTVSRRVPIDDDSDEDFGVPDLEPGDVFRIGRGRGKRMRTEIVSEPYTVYQQVQKDFDERRGLLREAASSPLYAHLQGAGVGAALRGLLGRGGVELGEGEEVAAEAELGEGAVLTPQLRGEAAFQALKSAVAAQVKEGLLTRVETITLRCYQPSLRLIYAPVWSLIYRYKRKRKKAWIDGARGEVGGDKVSVLAQWFS